MYYYSLLYILYYLLYLYKIMKIIIIAYLTFIQLILLFSISCKNLDNNLIVRTENSGDSQSICQRFYKELRKLDKNNSDLFKTKRGEPNNKWKCKTSFYVNYDSLRKIINELCASTPKESWLDYGDTYVKDVIPEKKMKSIFKKVVINHNKPNNYYY